MCPTVGVSCSDYARINKIMNYYSDATLIHEEQLAVTAGLNKKLIVCDKLFPRGSFIILTVNANILALNTSAEIDDLLIKKDNTTWTFQRLHPSKSYRFAFKVRLDVVHETKRGNFSYSYPVQGFFSQNIYLFTPSNNVIEKQAINYYRIISKLSVFVIA